MTINDAAVDAVTALTRPSLHSQACPVWTGRATATPASRCNCWIRRDAQLAVKAAAPAIEQRVREAIAVRIESVIPLARTGQHPAEAKDEAYTTAARIARGEE